MKNSTIRKVKSFAYLAAGCALMAIAVGPIAALALGFAALSAVTGAVAIIEDRPIRAPISEQPSK